LLRGRIAKFNLETLIDLAHQAGMPMRLIPEAA